MTAPVPFATLEAIATQLSVISIANGYNTDIGASVRINDAQRSLDELPSIAIGATSGQFNLTAEGGTNGGSKSPRARRCAITLEAAMQSPIEDEQRIAHLMLEDIERAFAQDTRLAPFSVRSLLLDTWSIVARPEGVDVVVLQILGSAEYQRPQT